MKIIDLLKHTRVDEAPLGDYQTIGDWGDQEKARSFAQQSDRRIIQHPATLRRAHKLFGRTEHVLNLYFVNQPGLRKFSETGFMEPADIAQAMPNAWPEIEARGKDGVDHENGINVIFVSNTGANRMNMTPWIMTHRIGHALQASERGGNRRRNSGPWSEYEVDAADFFSVILEEVYDWHINNRDFWFGGNDKLLAKFFEGIGGMRSARKGQLGGRPYEFLYEMFAQFVTTGQLKFRDCPKSFGMRNGRSYRIQDEDTAEMWNRDLNGGVGDHLSGRIDNTLYAAEGKFLVM
jgi:hypothetical protein